MFAPGQAVRFLEDAHRTRAGYQNLPLEIAPKTVAEAYAVQEALCARWAERLGPVAGLKIATTTKVMQQLMGIDHPCGGMIFASCVHRSPATIGKADYVNVRIECELAVKLGESLIPKVAPYTRESVRGAVSEIMAAFELIDDRNADYKTCKALSLIADNAWNAGIVISASRPLPASLELDGARFATPYGFVRALRAGGVRAPSVSVTDAVQLLTVHGAKGLEAKIVLMLDTDASAQRTQTMGVLVKWPGHAPA